MKRNAHILKHIPDFYDNKLPEPKYFYDVLATLDQNETEELVKTAYRERKQHYKMDDDEQIELNSQMKQQIDSVLNYKSKTTV